MALAFNPSFTYSAVEADDGKTYIVAEQLKNTVFKECKLTEKSVIGTYSGSELNMSGLNTRFCFRRSNFSIHRPWHSCRLRHARSRQRHRSHGSRAWCRRFQFRAEIWVGDLCALDDKGVYLEGLAEYKGKDVFTANPIIVKLLAARGALLAHHEYKHSYPHCWRCHNP